MSPPFRRNDGGFDDLQKWQGRYSWLDHLACSRATGHRPVIRVNDGFEEAHINSWLTYLNSKFSFCIDIDLRYLSPINDWRTDCPFKYS